MLRRLFALLILLSPQDPAVLLEKLRSDSLDEREEAVRRLLDLGPAAISALERAAKDPDAEVAGRARHILRVFQVRDSLTPVLRKTLPGIEERLASGGDREWTRAFLDALTKARTRGPVRSADLEPLAARALRGAQRREERDLVLLEVLQRGLRSVLPSLIDLALAEEDDALRVEMLRPVGRLDRRAAIDELLRLLQDPSPVLKARAALALGYFQAREAIPAIAPLLDGPETVSILATLHELDARQQVPAILKFLDSTDGAVRLKALVVLGSFRTPTPPIRKCLADRDTEVQANAIQVLEVLRCREAVPEILPLLRNASAEVRRAAAGALGSLQVTEALRPLSDLLRHPEPTTRWAALVALRSLDARAESRAILPLLQDPETGIRDQAILTLADFGATEAVPLLIPLLRDKEESIREKSLGALEWLAGRAAIPAFRALLDENPPQIRVEGVRALGRLGAREVLPDLLRCLDDPSHTVKTATLSVFAEWRTKEAAPKIATLLGGAAGDQALSVLTQIGNPEVLEEVLTRLRKPDVAGSANHINAAEVLLEQVPPGRARELLKDASPSVRLAALDSLNERRDLESLPLLRPLLDDENAGVRENAFTMLVNFVGREAIPTLVSKLADPDEILRASAARLLADLDAREEAEKIIPLLKDPDVDPYEVAEALARLGCRKAIPVLVEQLSIDSNRQQAALPALGKLKAFEAVPRIESLLEEESFEVRRAATEALARIDPARHVPTLLASLRGAQEDHRSAVAEVLADLDPSAAVPALLDMLSNPPAGEPDHGTCMALGRFSSPALDTALAAKLQHRDPWVRHSAALALGYCGARSRTPDLRRSLADPDDRVRSAAARSLGLIRSVDSAEDLIRALSDPHEKVRAAAAWALGTLREPAAQSALVKGLTDVEGEVRLASLQALRIEGLQASLLLPLLSDPDNRVPAMALEELGRLADPATLEGLLRFLCVPATSTGAASALGLIGDARAVEPLRATLLRGPLGAQCETAGALCLLGRREGVPLLLENSAHLSRLNALRSPAQWVKLKDRRIGDALQGHWMELVTLLAAEASLTLEVDPLGFEPWRWESFQIQDGATLATAFEVLGLYHPFILERDRIRFLPPDQAAEFWRKWWAEGGLKK